MGRLGTKASPKQKASGLKNLTKAHSSRVGVRGTHYRRKLR